MMAPKRKIVNTGRRQRRCRGQGELDSAWPDRHAERSYLADHVVSRRLVNVFIAAHYGRAAVRIGVGD
jgi:hypothetical protein